jgi:hypothetical protein
MASCQSLKASRRIRTIKILSVSTYCTISILLFGTSPLLGFQQLQPLPRIKRVQYVNNRNENNAFFMVNDSYSYEPRTWTQQCSGRTSRNTATSHPTTTPHNPSRTGTVGDFFQSPSTINNNKSYQQQQPSRRQKMKPMPVLGYDSHAIEDYYDMRPFEVAWRLNSLGFPLLGTGGLFWIEALYIFFLRFFVSLTCRIHV